MKKNRKKKKKKKKGEERNRMSKSWRLDTGVTNGVNEIPTRR